LEHRRGLSRLDEQFTLAVSHQSRIRAGPASASQHVIEKAQ
jgi:hypothetical protein